MPEKELLFLNRIHQPRLWGEEYWVVSAHNNGDCTVARGTYAGRTLSWLWHNKRELFGNLEGKSFPLLTKIIAAKDRLSVQVHPHDQYAGLKAKGEGGKTECWYVIDCEADAELIIGHNAVSKEQLINYIEAGRWDELLRRVKIKPGDFFYIPAGTIHGIGKGAQILETQQSSDVTYRLYDYDRLEEGKLRQLHIEDSIAVATVPHIQYTAENAIEELDCGKRELLIKDKYFSVNRLEVNGRQLFYNDKHFLIVSLLRGGGFIDDTKIEEGDHFIIPNNYKAYILEGNMELILSYI